MRHPQCILAAALALSSSPVLFAQAEDCNELTITSVLYAAFNPGSLEVDVSVNGPSFFNYPSFRLVNTDGDTIAREELTFFGIGEGQQQHRMDLLPGFSQPSSPFTGTLVLNFFTINGDSTCSWTLTDQVLCPPLPCTELQTYVWASGAVTTDFDWAITDQDNNTVGTGQFHLDSTVNAQDLDALCLPPGQYTMHLQQPVETQGSYTFGLTRNGFMIMGPTTTFEPGTTGHLPFFFYLPCVDGANTITEPTADAFAVNVQTDVLWITSINGDPIGLIDVLDLHGRVIAQERASGSSAAIDMSDNAPGIYFLRSLDRQITQRFVLNNL
jgi:hypothetical protein